MISIRTTYLNNLNFSDSSMSTLKTIGEYKGKQALFFHQTPEILETLKQVAVIESSESSNRLEGIVAPHDRIEGLVLKTTEPRNRSEQEIAGYRDALNLIHESNKYMDFSNNVILQLHSMLYRYMNVSAGSWKRSENEIVERNADGTVKRVRFKPVPAFDTPQAMDELIANYKLGINIDQKEPLVIIPLAILDFLCIHPFSDGNGRVSRLLTLMLLYHFDYEVGRFISLERIFEQSKETYYEVLEHCSQNWHDGKHDVQPWLNYFWGVMLAAYKEFEQRVGQIKVGKGSKTDQIQSAVMRKLGPFSISDIESDCPGISRDMVRLVLRQLRDEQIIVPQGKGRGAKWLVERRP